MLNGIYLRHVRVRSYTVFNVHLFKLSGAINSTFTHSLYRGANCRAGYLRAFSRSQVIINFHDVLVNYMVVRFSLLNGSGCVEKHGAPSVACFIHKRNSQTHIIRTYLVSYSPTLTHSLTHSLDDLSPTTVPFSSSAIPFCPQTSISFN